MYSLLLFCLGNVIILFLTSDEFITKIHSLTFILFSCKAFPIIDAISSMPCIPEDVTTPAGVSNNKHVSTFAA